MAEDVGKRLLGEVEEMRLDEVSPNMTADLLPFKMALT